MKPVSSTHDSTEVINLADTREQHTDEGPVLDPATPLETARAFLMDKYNEADTNTRTLHYHCGEFFRWAGIVYEPLEEAELRAEVYAYLDSARRPDKNDKARPFEPNQRRVSDVIDALKAEALLPSAKSPPAWIKESDVENNPPATEFLAMANGLLDVSRRELSPPTPTWFGTTALPVVYEEDAPDPKAWLAFLDSLWPDDPESINCLQEIAGYLIAGGTRQQKAFMLIGPKRSGKGTIARALAGILGTDNISSPTLNLFGSAFGLQRLIGKSLAIVSDCRLGRGADQSSIAETLLRVTGEDYIDVPRKYLLAWHGRLAARFLVISNEMPAIADPSAALAGRFIILKLTESFFGREDLTLDDRIAAEYSGIVNWALGGLERLQARGRFIQPTTGQALFDEMEALGAPVRVFVTDRCSVSPGLEVERSRLFNAWREWCSEAGRREPGTLAIFGRNLKAAFPTIGDNRPRTDFGPRPRHYTGIDLD